MGELLYMQPGWSTRTVHPLSFAIRYFSRPRANPFKLASVSHMFVVWTDALSGRREVHEALFGRGWSKQEFAKVEAFAKRKGNRVILGEPVHGHPFDVLHAYRESLAWTGSGSHQKRVSYATKQIFAIAVAKSLAGRWLNLQPARDPAQIMCSEGACALLAMCGDRYDLRTSPAQPFDAVTPQDALDTWRARGFGAKGL